MLDVFQSSPVTVSVWLAVILGLIAVSGTWLAGWVNRKRRSSVRAEDDRIAAEARNLEIQSISQLLSELRETRAELESEIRNGREKAEESRRQQHFLREQVRYHEELTILARQATHAAINEVQRCVIAIHFREEMLARHGIPMDGLAPFEPKDHEEIVRFREFPLPPKRLLDS